MPRFFVGTDQISDKDIVITGTDVNHIRNVLRMTPGEEVTVSDGQGMDYFCRIAELTKEEVRLDIVDSWHSFVELPAKIYLFQGLPKADKMELIIQKAVELGVYEIVPVATKRAVVKLDPKKEEKKRLRWQSIAESAAKQAEEKGLAEDVKFYLEFFQYGCPPHGGFGLGIDRLTMLLCGLSIKDAEFLFRGPNRLTP